MTSSHRRFRAVVLSFAALAAVAAPTPLLAQAQSCEADAPFQDPSVNASLLPAFNSKLSGAWPTAAAQKIDPLTDIPPFQTTVSCDPVGITACAATIVFPECEHITVNMQLDQITGLSQPTFSDMTVQNFNVKEVAQHTQSGPDAGKITDGVFAPEGEEWNHPSYTIVLTSGVSSAQFQNALLQSALTIDLGSPIQICSSSSQCGGATVQADRHSFALEYSTDGTSWTNYGTVPYKDSDGLHTRSVTIASSLGGQPVTAQYVRVYGQDDKDGDNNYSISEVELKDPQGKIISISKRAIGPRPYQITDGQVAPESHTWDDPTYAAVLRSVGEAHALVIDLGAPVNVCGSATCGPSVQADRHPFQFDYSQDGINWVSYSQVPEVSGSGLITRTPSQIAPTNPAIPSFTARYVRLYGLPADDDDYSISEVTLRNTATGNPVVSTGKLTYGPEALATDGEAAPEGADWNDPRYANILSPCGQPPNTNTICTQGSQTGLTGAVLIDLGDVLTLSALQVQADRHQFQIDYRASPADAWQPLYTVPSVSDDGLTTRPIQHLLDPQPQARYLMVYGTAGDDDNYSVSSVQVDSDIAKTPCAYASGANAGQQYASCSYDGTMTTKITVPSGALATSFTIVSAEAHYHCTSDVGSTDISVPDGEIIGGTSCTGNLQLPPGTLYTGGFCSATCGASTGPASVLTYASVSPEFTLTDLSCNHSTGNLTDAVNEVAAGTAATAVEEFFGALAVSPLPTPTGQVLPPMIPSGKCQPPPQPPANAHLRGWATHVGKANEAGRVRLRGAFIASRAAPLNTLALALHRVLHEDGGVEELVRARTGVPVAPLTLLPQKGSRAKRAVYATAPGVSPTIRAKVKKAKHGAPGQMNFTIDVRGAHMPTLPTCTEGSSPSVLLDTSFSLGTDSGPRIDVHALQDWQCEGKHRLTTQ